jgi:parallel beta-helix repeat protein
MLCWIVVIFKTDSVVAAISCFERSHIIGNFIENITGTAISLATSAPEFSIVSNNSIRDCGTGISTQSNSNTITSNTLHNCTLGVRLLGADNNTLSNNNLSGTGDLSITLTTTATSNTISHNQATVKLTSALDTEIEGIIYNKIQTSDATPTTISTIPIPTDDTQYLFDVVVTAMSTDEVDFGIWKRTLVVKRIAGVTTISLFNADVDSQTNLLPASITAGVSGANIDIQATGVVNTINWVGGHKSLSQSPTP